MKIASKPLPHGKHTVTPYILAKGAAEFIDFLKNAFDAHEFGRVANPDGKIGHAEVQVGDSTLEDVSAEEAWKQFENPEELAIMQNAQETFGKEMDKHFLRE